MRRTENPISRLMARLLPATLGGRLVLTVLLLSLAITAITIGINGILIASQIDIWGQEGASANLKGLLAFNAREVTNLQADVEEFEDDDSFRSLMQAGDVQALDSRYGALVRAQTEAVAIAAVDETGNVLFQYGSGADVTRLIGLAVKSPTAEVSGMMSSSAGTVYVYGSPVTGIRTSSKVGYLIAARLFSEDQAAQYASVAGNASLAMDHPGFRPPGVVFSESRLGEHRFLYAVEPESLVMLYDIPSIAGGTAGTAMIVDRDTRSQKANAAAVLSTLLSGILAIAIGLGLGTWLTRVMRTPVVKMVDHVKTRGYLAAEGAPYASEESFDDSSLPTEFRELGAVFDDLLRHLTSRQSELKTAIRKANYAEETLGIVVSESLELKIVLQDGRVVLANPAASMALGVPQAALLDRTASDVFGDVRIRTEDGVEMDALDLLERILEAPATISLERPDQAERWFLIQAVRHADDLHNRILMTARDVTEERRLQSIRSEIVSLISHDLRSPLAVVIGYLDLLHRPLSDEDRERAIDSAKRNAARMSDLLEDLLSATRAEELLAPSELVPIPLALVAEDVVNSIAPTHSERQLLFEALGSPVVLGEEKRLRQILVNLVTNAYKYASDDAPIIVRVYSEGDHAYAAVVDHGPGVPESERTRIFERFERLETGSARPGMGLGLYIVRIISENHAGCVRVTETPGGGATFVVELPLAGSFTDGKIVMRRRPAAKE
ncbi:MAG: HAMP domain-containing sensor histidine kinase [Coriobacteriia bacterium]|nr:HAMP domain-containing sensor histidine kinase [Coriobacteriia bacterium]